MRRIYPNIVNETIQEQHDAKRYNPALQAVLVRHKREVFCTLGAGRSDSLHFWQDKDDLHVVSINSRYGYVGLEIFDRFSGDLLYTEFVQNAVEELGPKGTDYAPSTIRRWLYKEISD